MPKSVNTPWGLVNVPDDATDDEIDQLVNEMDPERVSLAPVPSHEPSSMPRAVSMGERIAGTSKNIHDAVRRGEFPAFADLRDAAYNASPLPMFEKENLPGTAGAVVGAGLGATGFGASVSVPASMAVAGGVTKLMGGSNEDAAKNAAWELAGPIGGMALNRAVLQPVGKALIRTGLNIGNATPHEVDQVVETAIRENVSPGRHGWFKAQNRVDALNQKVREMIEGLEGQSVNPSTAMANLRKLRVELETSGGATRGELAAVDNLIEDYSRYGRMKPIDAHELKASIQHRISSSYDQTVPSTVNEGRQAYAAGLRQEIEEAGKRGGHTEIGATNERVGNLRELQKMMSTQPQQSRVQGSDVAAAKMFGPEAAFTRMALRPRAQAYLGLKMARTGRLIDPTLGVATATHTAEAPIYPGRPTTLDQLGIPEEAARRAYEPNGLDAFDVPVVDGGERTVDELWLRRLSGDEGMPVSVAEDFAQKGGLRAVGMEDTPANRATSGAAMKNAKPLTKQTLMEMFRRYQRMRGQIE